MPGRFPSLRGATSPRARPRPLLFAAPPQRRDDRDESMPPTRNTPRAVSRCRAHTRREHGTRWYAALVVCALEGKEQQLHAGPHVVEEIVHALDVGLIDAASR